MPILTPQKRTQIWISSIYQEGWTTYTNNSFHKTQVGRVMNEVCNRKWISSGVIEKKNVWLVLQAKMSDKLCVLAPTWETILSTNEIVQKFFSNVCQDHWTRSNLKRNLQEPPLSGMMNSIKHNNPSDETKANWTFILNLGFLPLPGEMKCWRKRRFSSTINLKCDIVHNI